MRRPQIRSAISVLDVRLRELVVDKTVVQNLCNFMTVQGKAIGKIAIQNRARGKPIGDKLVQHCGEWCKT